MSSILSKNQINLLTFLSNEKLKDYPNMIKKIDPKEWQEFFMKEAKRLVELKIE